MKRGLIITIDGPSGAGKSTIAKLMAKRLGYIYIDTGAMYRGVAYAVKMHRGGKSDEEGLDMFLEDLDLEFDFRDKTEVILDGTDISEEIRLPEVSMLASRLSQNKKVRDFLTKKQREIGKDGGVVLEGRDTGSIVFPDADIKFYLDAKNHERAKRRFIELSEKGMASDMEKVRQEMEIRDREDSKRDIAPLIVPHGAIYIDTTGLDIDGVLDKILGYVRDRV